MPRVSLCHMSRVLGVGHEIALPSGTVALPVTARDSAVLTEMTFGLTFLSCVPLV